MGAVAKPGPGQHQVWQGWPWGAGSGPSRVSIPWAPTDPLTAAPVGWVRLRQLCTLFSGHYLVLLPNGAIPTAWRTLGPLGQGHPLWVAQSRLTLACPPGTLSPGWPSSPCDP